MASEQPEEEYLREIEPVGKFPRPWAP
jgi:hypothetical protein